jgi:myo-inositol-1-phosphate synthase
VTAFGVVSNPGSVADFTKLKLGADQAAVWTGATAAGSLNLSAAELASFQKLGSGASVEAVEQQVRELLLARVQAYRTQGLAGIAPYVRASGERSAGAELRTATEASKALSTYAPAAYQALLSYPNAKPAGAREVFHWSQFDAHGTPTIALTHVLLIPDGDAWITAQRQFYVSAGYNAEQALAAFLPSSGGTVVVYGNRTSTDQITGFGASTKRSLGSRVLASQLEEMFGRARKAVTQ